jgi:hypothetical protein
MNSSTNLVVNIYEKDEKQSIYIVHRLDYYHHSITIEKNKILESIDLTMRLSPNCCHQKQKT